MDRIVLVGLPGSGKTTVGRALALAMDQEFRDTDEVFAEREGVRVADYLRREGEVRFRERELVALHSALETAGVVATGGGIVVSAAAREVLEREFTLWLDCADETLLGRVGEGDRPLLGEHPAQRLVELRRERSEWYRRVSRQRVDADREVDDVVGDLVRLVEREDSRS